MSVNVCCGREQGGREGAGCGWCVSWYVTCVSVRVTHGIIICGTAEVSKVLSDLVVRAVAPFVYSTAPVVGVGDVVLHEEMEADVQT